MVRVARLFQFNGGGETLLTLRVANLMIQAEAQFHQPRYFVHSGVQVRVVHCKRLTEFNTRRQQVLRFVYWPQVVPVAGKQKSAFP